MNETKFRERFREAIGEPPLTDLSRRRLEAALSTPSSRPRSLAIGSIAATVALLLVAVFTGWRLLDSRHILPAGTQPTAAPSAAPTASGGVPACRMPVIVRLESGPPGQLQVQAGFLDTGTGRYTPDTSSSVKDLPGGAFLGTVVKPSRAAEPASYSESLHRWLPVDKRSVSPDGRSYVWQRLLPEGSNYTTVQRTELHRYDVATSIDRTLWTHEGSVDVISWNASGIELETLPPNGGVLVSWLIDPVTGDATQQATGFAARPHLTQLPSDPLQNGGFGYGSFGTEFRGHTIYRIGSRDPGSPEIVVYETSPGKRVTIYQGSQGDATGFDPLFGLSDATGVWFTDYSGRVLWRWQPDTGLHKVQLSGLPLSGRNAGLYENPAGACMPPK